MIRHHVRELSCILSTCITGVTQQSAAPANLGIHTLIKLRGKPNKTVWINMSAY